MTVRARFKIDDQQIANMELTISMTMKVSEWREMRKVMGDTWPCWDVRTVIGNALNEIESATEKRFTIPQE